MSNLERLEQLLLNDRGFAFDPVAGQTYVLSPSGLRIVAWLREGCAPDELSSRLSCEYEVDRQTAARDVDNFLSHLRSCKWL